MRKGAVIMTTTQDILHIEYVSGATSDYYIDKDVYSKAHRVDDDTVILHSFGGTYTFSDSDHNVTLSDGVKTIPVNHMIRRWTVYGE